MAIKCYGWIPILTSRLLVTKVPAERFFKNPSDRKSQEVEGRFTFNADKLISGFTLDFSKKGKLAVNCDISSTGLVEYNFDEIKLSRDPLFNKIINQHMLPIFIHDIIRDIYHDHVHHDKKADSKLKPVLADNKEKAVQAILAQYENKIIDYHKHAKKLKKLWYIPYPLTKVIAWKRRMYFLASGNGEFTYAKSFINLHSDIIKGIVKDFDLLEKSFGFADSSVLTLKEKFSWQIMYFISMVALAVTIMGLISIAEPVCKLLNYIIPSLKISFCLPSIPN